MVLADSQDGKPCIRFEEVFQAALTVDLLLPPLLSSVLGAVMLEELYRPSTVSSLDLNHVVEGCKHTFRVGTKDRPCSGILYPSRRRCETVLSRALLRRT